jgi:DNA repair exonuclease SbcCD ATPase subunit
MRNIEFIEAGAENFCNYIDPIILPIKSNSLTLITGPNGSGKTTMFDIIPYTLYNKTSKDLIGDDAVNDAVGKDCHTWIVWKEESDLYRADRYCKHKKFGNTALLSKNGENIKRGHAEFVKEIEKLLLPQKLLMNTLYFSQKIRTFFTDLGDAEQKAIFRMILQLEEFTGYYDEAAKQLKVLNSDHDKLKTKVEVTKNLITETESQFQTVIKQKDLFHVNKQLYLDDLTYKLKNLNCEYINLEIELNKIDRNIGDKITKIQVEIENNRNQRIGFDQDKNNQIKEMESKLKLKQSEFSNIAIQQKAELVSDANIKKQSLSSETEKLNKLKLEKNTTGSLFENERKNYLRVSSEIAKLEIEITRIKDSFIEEEVICELCRQVVGNDKIIHLKNHLSEKEKESEILKIECNQYSIETKRLNTKIMELDPAIGDVEIDISSKLRNIDEYLKFKSNEIEEKLKVAFGKLMSKITECNNMIERSYTQNTYSVNQKLSKLQIDLKNNQDILEEKKEKIEKFDRIKLDLGSIKTQITSKEDEKFDEEILTSLKHRNSELLKDLKETETSINEQLCVMEMVEFWKVGFSPSGIPNILIDESIPFMNSKVSEYLEKISGGRYLVSFDTMGQTKSGEFRDKISVNVLDTFTKANTRKKLSGGQTRVVDIATILTLSDLQCLVQDVRFNIILFDEIFDALDDENIGYVSKILRYLARDKSIFIISHRHVDQIEADETLSFFNKK